MVNFGEFLKTETCGQTVLPDRSILKGQNAKIEKVKCDILGDFQTLCNGTHLRILKQIPPF